MSLRNENVLAFEDLAIDFEDKVVFLDIDGTIAADNHDGVSDRAQEKIKEMQQKNKVYLCTNSTKKARKEKIKNLLGLEIINHRLKKPSRRIIRGLQHNGNLLVIGDKLLIDGWFAKRIKARFIKVKRNVSGGESWIMKLLNVVDDFVCKFVK